MFRRDNACPHGKVCLHSPRAMPAQAQTTHKFKQTVQFLSGSPEVVLKISTVESATQPPRARRSANLWPIGPSRTRQQANPLAGKARVGGHGENLGKGFSHPWPATTWTGGRHDFIWLLSVTICARPYAAPLESFQNIPAYEENGN